jgi:hypothetical protein
MGLFVVVSRSPEVPLQPPLRLPLLPGVAAGRVTTSTPCVPALQSLAPSNVSPSKAP